MMIRTVRLMEWVAGASRAQVCAAALAVVRQPVRQQLISVLLRHADRLVHLAWRRAEGARRDDFRRIST